MPETITALATAPGTSGLAVIRVSGPDAINLASISFFGKVKLEQAKSHTIHYGKFYHEGKLIDTVTASVFHEPNSYTGENVVEISCHGGSLVVAEIINALLSNGARQAQSGEFTRRAFLNGKLDLMQVEAVADIIHSTSVHGAQTSARQLAGEFKNRISELRQRLIDSASLLELELDFADEDIELIEKDKIIERIEDTKSFCRDLYNSYKSAEILRSGYFVGIVGYPNSGKSTLFNTFLQRHRAIVSEIPGTTRDYLEETIIIDGIAVRIIDTAGLRETTDTIEIEGIKLVDSVLKQSNLILVLNDLSVDRQYSDSLFEHLKENYPDHELIMVQNKADKLDEIPSLNPEQILISAKNGNGIEELKMIISERARVSMERINDILVNQRHAVLLRRAESELESAIISLMEGFDATAVSIDIRRAVKTLGEITGEIWSEDVLNNIFSRFCIGK
jgi:tRNA modification GTPase